MSAWKLSAASVLVAASALATVSAQVQSQPYSGASDYQVYCSSCHGPQARGDGVIAKSLKTQPSDLTQLTKLNNGVFPEEKVAKTVVGRQGTAHRDSEMPAWAEVFAKSSDSAGAEQAAVRIGVLVKYLETLQVK